MSIIWLIIGFVVVVYVVGSGSLLAQRVKNIEKLLVDLTNKK